MANRSSAGVKRSSAARQELHAEEVLEALRELIPQVSSPVVQECLRAARCEIAYLTSTEETLAEEDDEDLDEQLDETLETLKDAG